MDSVGIQNDYNINHFTSVDICNYNKDNVDSRKMNSENESQKAARTGRKDNKDTEIKSINSHKIIQNVTTRLEFSIHKGTNVIMAKVINNDTNEVIREVPPEKILDLIAKLCEKAGIIVDKRV